MTPIGLSICACRRRVPTNNGRDKAATGSTPRDGLARSLHFKSHHLLGLLAKPRNAEPDHIAGL